MMHHEGGCLCGALRYQALCQPLHVTMCHCRFCQRATGGAYMVEPIFRCEDVRLIKGVPTVYSMPSAGSGKNVHVNFCNACGTKIYLAFERFPGFLGVYAGTFDDPDWVEVRPGNAKQIFLDEARPDTIVMPGIDAYGQHAMLNDGSPTKPFTVDRPRSAGTTRAAVDS